MRRMLLPLLLSVAPAAGGEGLATLVEDGKAGLELRYRYESVEQADRPQMAGANTLRLRLCLATGAVRGFSAVGEFDHVQALGGEHHDDTRNGLTSRPVVADPEGTDLNQAYIQYVAPRETTLRLGRQRIGLDQERFVGAVGWRQNEQTFDALRIETKAIPGAAFNYAFIDRVQRVFGPDPGVPPAHLEGAIHALTARLTSLPVGAISVYGFHLDFDDAPQLSSSTWGARYDGNRRLGGDWSIAWALDYARQQDAGGNAASVDAYYNLVEVALKAPSLGFAAGREVLSGEAGTFAATTNPAFQTPLATLHKWQGWADKFLTTPSAGIEDLYLGANAKYRGWNAQAVWHDFSAEATGADYGSELNVSVSRKFADRYELLVKYAGYDADELFADTAKFWIQLAASF
ncbi:MAG: alginate export family protein [Gammaproteobacteria bacterium]